MGLKIVNRDLDCVAVIETSNIAGEMVNIEGIGMIKIRGLSFVERKRVEVFVIGILLIKLTSSAPILSTSDRAIVVFPEPVPPQIPIIIFSIYPALPILPTIRVSSCLKVLATF